MIRKTFMYIGLIFLLIFSLPFLLIGKINKNIMYNKKVLKQICNIANFISGNKIHIKNIEYLTQNNNYLLVPNHLSYFDIISIMSFSDKPIHFFAKKSLLNFPIINWWLETQEPIFIDKNDFRNVAKCLKQGQSFLANGENVGIFPQGTRDTKNINFNDGINKLVKNNTLIIPLTIKNTHLVFEERKNNKKIDTEFIFHKPFYSNELENENLAKYLEEVIKNA